MKNMKRIYFVINLVIGVFSYQNCFAVGSLFNVSPSGQNQVITTNIPNHFYPNAGIKVTSPNFSLKNVGTQCSMLGNGYCLFPVSDTSPATITLQALSQGATAKYILCLNGKGPISCQNYTTISSPKFAYAGNYTNDNLAICNVDSGTGELSNCGTTGDNLARPIEVTFNSAGTLAYVPNFDANVSLCNVDSNTGAISGCATTGDAISSPTWVTLNAAGNLAYISDYSDSLIYLCSVDPNTGALSATCNTTGSGVTSPQQIVINNAGTFAYIGNFQSGVLTLCQIDGGGNLINCGSAGPSFSSTPGVALSPDGNYAYVADESASVVYQCAVNSGTGALSGCHSTGSNFDGPDSIAINAAGTLAYVANYADDSVTKCSIDSSGAFHSCNTTGSGFVHFVAGITLYY